MNKPIKVAYCTLNRVIQRLNADSSAINVSTVAAQTTQINTEDANTQAELKIAIYEASDMIRQATHNEFMPYLATWTLRGMSYRKHLYKYDSQYGGFPFSLPDNNLTISAFTWDGTSFTENTHYYRNPLESYPTHELIIDGDALTSYPDDFTDSVSVVGVWGFHRDPDNMWTDSGDSVQDSPLSSAATTLNVTSGNNFQVLQYIRIDSEYLLITAITSNALTVERGVNGTTAASHTNATQIDTFTPLQDVADECARLAIRRYQLRSGMEFIPVGDGGIKELGMGSVKLPATYTRYYMGSA